MNRQKKTKVDGRPIAPVMNFIIYFFFIWVMAYLKVACLVAKPLNRIEAMVTLLINQSINQSKFIV